MVSQVPVSIGFNNKTGGPRISSTGDTKIVTHRELVAVVAGTTNFTVFSAPINPGVYNTFPWLSTEALTYEMYRWEFLGFEYEPSSSTSNSGVVMMAIDFDAHDAVPESEQQFMNLCDAVEGPTWGAISYVTSRINFDRQFPNKFVRVNDSVPNTDIHSYDVGNFMYATLGQTVTTNIGRIFANYRCAFMIPNLPTLASRGTYCLDLYNPAGVTVAYPLSNTSYPLINNGNLYSYLFASGVTSGGSLELGIYGTSPGEYYRVECKWIGTGFVSNPTLVPFDTSCSTVTNNEGWSSLSGTTNAMVVTIVKANLTYILLSLTAMTTITTCSYVSVSCYGLAHATTFA